MKRSEVFAEYVIRNGLIRDNGMFEAETPAIVHFYDAYLNGGADEESADGGLWFIVTDEDRNEWSEELAGYYGVSLYCSDSGFWGLDSYETEAEYQTALDAANEVDEEGDDSDY